MTHPWYYDNKVYSDRAALMWAVCHVQTMLPRMGDDLSERVPDIVLSYVFTHKAEDNVSSAAHTAKAV